MRRLRQRLGGVIVGLMLATPAFAQNTTTPPVLVTPNTPFTISWDQNLTLLTPGDVPNYRWWCDGQIIKNFATTDLTTAATINADNTTTIQAGVPGLAPGIHSCLVSIDTPLFPTKLQSAPLGVPAGVQPTAPKNLHIVQTQTTTVTTMTILSGGGQ